PSHRTIFQDGGVVEEKEAFLCDNTEKTPAFKAMKEFIFYYDIVCPFAYVASRLIERFARRLESQLVWRPVLLGGLYKGTTGDGNHSMLESNSPAKLKIIGQDLRRAMYRNNVEAISPSQFPRNSLNCMRLLAAASQHSTKTCVDLTHWLYRAFFVHDKDIARLDVLEEAISSVGWNVNIDQVITGIGKEVLWKNVQEALGRGAFGVPSFWVNNRLYYGVDHLHFLEMELGNPMAAEQRLVHPPSSPQKAKLTIYYDFASPWAYVGSTQIPKLLESVFPVQVDVEWVPILVGVLFKSIGTPMLPMLAVSEAKRNYGMQDLKDWVKYRGIQFQWTSTFPLRTVLPSRVALVNGDDRLRQTI
ncbi:hypothetical protein QZH41_010676, partial [Actinostola sp. cb2023]